MAAAVRKMQQDPCIFPLYRLGFYGDSQLTAQFSAQIQADACGLPIVPAVGSGKSFIKNASDLTVLYANTVVFQEQRSPVVFPDGMDGDAAVLPLFIFDGIEEDLVQDKFQPFIITVYRFFASLQIHLHIIFYQVRADALDGSQL